MKSWADTTAGKLEFWDPDHRAVRGGSGEPETEKQASWRVCTEGGLGQKAGRTEEIWSWLMLWTASWGKSGTWSGMHYEFLGSSDLGWICGIRNNHEWDFWSNKSYRLWYRWRRNKESPSLLYQKGWRKLKTFCDDNLGASLRHSCGDPGLEPRAHTQVYYTTLHPSAKKLAIFHITRTTKACQVACKSN